MTDHDFVQAFDHKEKTMTKDEKIKILSEALEKIVLYYQKQGHQSSCWAIAKSALSKLPAPQTESEDQKKHGGK